jgi:hypothetical protein
MRFSFASLALFVNLVLAAPAVLKTVETAAQKKADSYIVVLEDSCDKTSIIAELGKYLSGDEAVTHNWDILNGFAATLGPNALNFLRVSPCVSPRLQNLCSWLF